MAVGWCGDAIDKPCPLKQALYSLLTDELGGLAGDLLFQIP
jgi:hypothetical protein